jgi:hypothetical protein
MKSVKKSKKPIKTFKYIKNKKTIKRKRGRKNVHKKRTTLKKIHKQTGGDTPMSKIIKDINFFTDKDKVNYPDIEEYLNPIYGVIMRECGYIKNNYYLSKLRVEKTRQPQTREMKFIGQITTFVDIVRPTKDIYNISPYSFGRYMAILYFYNETKNKIVYELLINKLLLDNKLDANFATPFKLLSGHLNPNNPNETTSKEIFHILLYCLWWCSNDMNGIIQYYKGLNHTFQELNSKALDFSYTLDFSNKTILFEFTKSAIKKVNEEDLAKTYPEDVNASDGDKAARKHSINDAKQKLTRDYTVARQLVDIGTIIEGLNQKEFTLDNFANDDNKKQTNVRVIKEVIRAVNKTLEDVREFPIVVLNPQQHSHTFENIVCGIVSISNPFKIMKDTSYVKSFSDEVKSVSGVYKSPTYSDCVETTMRNLINFLLYDGAKFKFDIDKIKDIKDINPQTLRYYEVFGSLEKQSSSTEQDIYSQKLIAADAWSYLIIFHANQNIKFSKKSTIKGTPHEYEVDSGCMTVDETKPNFIQLLQNLLSPELFKNPENPKDIEEDFKKINKRIVSVHFSVNALKTGLGNIKIEYHDDDDKYSINISLESGHSYMTVQNYKNYKVPSEYKENKYISYLLHSTQGVTITDENYLWFKYTVETLEQRYNMGGITQLKFLEMLVSELGNDDVRHRIRDVHIDVDQITAENNFIYIDKATDLNNYSYTSHDFKFVDMIKNLTSWNRHLFKDTTIKALPDLTPLTRFTSIGDTFAFDCAEISEIDLSKLTYLTKIGEGFAENCENLQKIVLPIKLTSIGNGFAANCINLTTFNFNGLPELETIGNKFMNSCYGLATIDLSPLKKLTSIGNGFAVNCIRLTTINFDGLSELKTIGNEFLNNTNGVGSKIDTIDLSPLKKLTSIGKNFLSYNSKLTTFKLHGLSELKTIGGYFLSKCKVLETIELSKLPNLEVVGPTFAWGCESLKTVKLIDLPNLKSIGLDFVDDTPLDTPYFTYGDEDDFPKRAKTIIDTLS